MPHLVAHIVKRFAPFRSHRSVGGYGVGDNNPGFGQQQNITEQRRPLFRTFACRYVLQSGLSDVE